MRILKSVLCFALVFLSTACTEQDFIQGRLQKATIVASIDEDSSQPITRTVVDESNPKVTGISWSPGDAIGVYGANGQTINSQFVSTNKVNSPEATFSGDIIEGDDPKYAYYPYSEANDGVAYTAVTGEVPQVQTYSSIDGRLSYDYKVGTPKANATSEFTFKHLVTLFRITVDATGVDEVADENLESVTISFPETVKVGGEFSVNLKTFSESQTVADAAQAITWKSEHKKDLTLQWTDTPSLSNGTIMGYLVCAPIADVKDNTVTVTVQTTSRVISFNAKLRSNFKMGCVYTFPLTLAEWQKAEGSNWNVEDKPEAPEIFSLSFNAASSVPVSGDTTQIHSILKRKVYAKNTTNHNSTTYTDSDASYYNHTATLEGTNFSLYVPYLNSRKLVPTVSYTEGATIQYKNEQGEFVDWDGESAIDFTTYNTLRVTKSNVYKDYTVTLSNTGLPVVVISQPGGDESWDNVGLTVFSKPSEFPTDGKVTFYNADGTVDASVGLSGVRLRGNTSLEFPKKPFAIKLDKKTEVYGMAKHKRWVLLANWKDRTLMRNAVGFGLADIVANAFEDGIGWQPSGKFVEVVYNNVHIGNYYLCEQIKIDGNRLDINDPYEDVLEDFNEGKRTDAPAIANCGYLLESDDGYDENCKFTTRHYIPFHFKDDVADEMLTYVQNKVQGIEDNLYNGNYETAYEDFDLNSHIDFWFIQELTMNGEMKHPKSVYSYIDGNGKLTAGPVWDFDWQTFPIIDNIGSGLFSSYDYEYTKSMVESADHRRKSSGIPTEPNFEGDAPYMWYPMLFKDATFKTVAAERWDVVAPQLLAYQSEIIKMGQELAKSWEVNQAMWPNGKSVIQSKWTGSHALCGDENYSFEEAYNAMSNTLQTRINGMDFIANKEYPSVSIKLR